MVLMSKTCRIEAILNILFSINISTTNCTYKSLEWWHCFACDSCRIIRWTNRPSWTLQWVSWKNFVLRQREGEWEREREERFNAVFSFAFYVMLLGFWKPCSQVTDIYLTHQSIAFIWHRACVASASEHRTNFRITINRLVTLLMFMALFAIMFATAVPIYDFESFFFCSLFVANQMISPQMLHMCYCAACISHSHNSSESTVLCAVECMADDLIL